jgi:ferrous iron transport protein B
LKKYTIALAGNPNCGKTTLFNAFTGSKQRVGNWPGVTVEKIVGHYSYQNCEYEVIDLPGIYSFSARSMDEKVSREFILMEKPDLVVNIVDATNLERTLYLTTQLLEMKIPVIIALNMMDMAKQRRIKIELEHLAKHLDTKIISIVAPKKQGLDELKQQIAESVEKQHIPHTQVEYDSVVETAINEIAPQLDKYAKKYQVDKRWLAIKLLEEDKLAAQLTNSDLADLVNQQIQKIEKHTNNDVEIVIADGRYGFIHGLTLDVVHKAGDARRNFSDLVDSIVLNRVLSIPIFLGVMYLVFMLTINVGSPFIDFFDNLMGTIFVDGTEYFLQSLNAPAWLILLLAQALGGSIQTISTFIPPIFFMFLSLSILEDSGYMSRAAFVMDRFMRFIGLPGKAFIPMLVGFGCNVPAIMATRTLENKKDRLLTILINPLMSCGARLPVYTLFAAVFFPEHGGQVIFALYLTGIVLAIIFGLIFKKTLFKGETSTFVMELSPYHLPTFNGIMLHTWQRLKGFIIRAGKVIVIFIIILTVLNSVGIDGSLGNQDSENSVLSYIGKKISPIFQPMGVQQKNWPAVVGMMTGIFAKETVVGTLDALYSQLAGTQQQVEEETGYDFTSGIVASFRAIATGFGIIEAKDGETTLQKGVTREMMNRFGGKNNAFAYLLFILIYAPCVAVIGAIYKETNLKWTFFSVSYLTMLAWLVATLFYQVSIIAIQPAVSLGWILGISLIFFGFYKTLQKIKPGETF